MSLVPLLLQIGYQEDTVPFEMLALIASGVVILSVVVIVSWWFLRGKRYRIAQLRLLNFNKTRFIRDMRAFNVGAYNQRILYILVPLGIGMFVPLVAAVILNDPILAPLIMFAGLAMTGVITMFVYVWLQKKEGDLNRNKAWGDTQTYYSGLGFQPGTWRRMEPEGDPIRLSDSQFAKFVEMVKNTLWPVVEAYAKTLKVKGDDGKERDYTEADFLAGVKNGLSQCIYQQFKVMENYRVLLALKHNWKDCENPYGVEKFDLMTYVTVHLAPLTLAYVDGDTNKIVESVDDKGKEAWVDRAMGVFVVLVDRLDMLTMISTGRFDAPSQFDGLLAKLVHAYQQDATRAETLENKTRQVEQEREEREKDKHKKDTRASRDFNNAMAAADVLFGHSSTTEKAFQMWALVATMILFFLLFFMLVPR